ncbi:hypothetical protein F8237_31365 [Bradyrhizobium betae]|uniref:Uncharacterized protein n=2 Tax=Bradyrhizobium betae TaxID=244734 RepID=A0A5P6PDS8_9BRAD|nr:hypothetical protein F8237_31365 [Bradyrhizobium betae]
MRSLSRLAVACSYVALLTCGPGGITVSQAMTPATSSPTTLPSVTVDAPSQTPRRSKPIRHPAVARGAVQRQSSPTTETSLSATLAAPTSVMTKLAKLESISGSCVDGCQTSFRTGNAPWRGCSASGWPALSTTCRNIYHFKTYAECTGTGLLLGWQSRELTWYCSSLALK